MNKKNTIFRDSDFYYVTDGQTQHRGIELELAYAITSFIDAVCREPCQAYQVTTRSAGLISMATSSIPHHVTSQTCSYFGKQTT